MSIKVLHTGDLHFQNKPDILDEVCRVADFIVDEAAVQQPQLIILAGDTLDEFHGRIRIDSDAARAAINFVTALADIAPVAIVLGTKSHDREAPYIFQHLRAVHPIHVTTAPEMIGLHSDLAAPFPSFSFVPYGAPCKDDLLAVLTMIPSLDKAYLQAESVRQGNRDFRDLFFDLCAGFGVVNEAITVPRIFVGHGMVTGATFSSGQQAVGEDLEMSLDALRAAKCDYVALGHVHCRQSFPGNIHYSGSPGRLNFGEPEEKSINVIEIAHGGPLSIAVVPTPARRFVFIECALDDLHFEIDTHDLKDAHVRVRFALNEARRHEVDKTALEARVLAKGAALVKVDFQVIPVMRQRAAGISQETTLTAKVQRWAKVAEVELPARVLEIAGVIEGREVDELMREALIV